MTTKQFGTSNEETEILKFDQLNIDLSDLVILV